MNHRARTALFAVLLPAASCSALPSPSAAPEATAPASWASVDVGADHTCALDSVGRAFCWGGNHHGQLGARTPETCAPAHHGGDHHTCWPSSSDVPVAAAGGMRFAALSAGGSRSCGLDADGHAWCWGRDVGTQRAGCANASVCSFDPVPMAPELAFRLLGVGEDAVCGITRSGEGHCFRPRRAAGEPSWAAVLVAPGRRLAAIDHYGNWMDPDRHVICAVDDAGSAWCQGDNRYAQLGAGDTVPRAGAVRVAAADRFADVRARSSWACGLTAEGAALCWGSLADRPSWPGGSPPEPDLFACTWSAWCGAPRPGAPGLRFTALTFVHQSFCGLTAEGELHCWNRQGALHRAAEGTRFTAVDGGQMHACGRAADGSVWCWGSGIDLDRTRLVRAPDPPR